MTPKQEAVTSEFGNYKNDVFSNLHSLAMQNKLTMKCFVVNVYPLIVRFKVSGSHAISAN